MEPEQHERGRHPASAVEARLRGLVSPLLVNRGWRPRVVAFPGYGGQGWVRVLARVLLVPPGSGSHASDARGWRRFVTAPAAGVPVRIEVGEQSWDVTTGRDGYVDVRLDVDVPPGWGSASLTVAGREPVAAPLRVVGPDTRLGVVSDIDDTVIVTMLPRPLLAFRNAFLLPESDRRAVPGMARLYSAIVDEHPDAFVVYLSTGAWNVAPALARFLRRHRFPAGPMLLTDWGPTEQTLFRSGPEHKRTQLRRLFTELPQLRWLLIGDDGQHDPSLYAEAADEHPDKVLGIVIRELSLGEQVASHVIPVKDSASVGGHAEPVSGPDGDSLLNAMVARGLLSGPSGGQSRP